MADILRLDPIRCDAYGMCAELLPELIALDDWGYPLVADAEVVRAMEGLRATGRTRATRRSNAG